MVAPVTPRVVETVAAPVTVTPPDNVVTPVTVRVELIVVALVTVRLCKVDNELGTPRVELIVVAPVTVRVFPKEVKPVTLTLPPIFAIFPTKRRLLNEASL